MGVTTVLIFFFSKEYDSVILFCCQLNVIGFHYITFHRLSLFYNTSKKQEKKTREEIEEQQSTETENLNKGRLTVRFVLLRLQLKSQYSLVYKRGDSIKEGTKIFQVVCLGMARGGYFRSFWVEMCRWDPGALNLYQPTDQFPEK